MATNIIPSNLPSVFDVIKMLSTLEQQAIIRPTNPPKGIAGFLFDIVGDETLILESDITDYYTENGQNIQDNIANKPEVFTVKGLVAELTNAIFTPEKTASIEDTLPLNASYVPTLSPEAQQNQDDAQALSVSQASSITSTNSLYSFYNDKSQGASSLSKQSKVANYFYQLWKARTMFSVETPYGIFNSMAITSCRIVQSEESVSKSELTIIFKKINLAKDITIQLGQLAGRAAQQSAPTTENGNLGTPPATTSQNRSWLSGAFSK